MKWKNFQQPNAGYFITTTTRNFIPLLNHNEARNIAYSSLAFLKDKYHYRIIGYCIMPDHMHLLIQADGSLDISKVMADFKRFTANQIYSYFQKNQDHYWLNILKAGAYKGQKFSVWQETFRSELIYSEKFLLQKLNYLHNNPVRKKITKDAVNWPHSSASFYYLNKVGKLEVEPLSVSA